MNKIDNQIAAITVKYQPKEITKLKGKIKIVRADGFTVFLDRINVNDPDRDILTELNHFRLTSKPIDVMMAVGYVRGLQISRNYACSHSKHDLPELQKIITTVFKNAVMHKQIK